MKNALSNGLLASLLALFCTIPNFMLGQKLEWLPPSPEFKKDLNYLGYVGHSDNDILLSQATYLFVVDRKTFKVKQVLDTKDISDAKGERYVGMLKLEKGWTGMVQAFRMLKKDDDYELKTAALTDKGFSAPKPWLVIPREELRENSTVALGFEVSGNGKYILGPMKDKATKKEMRIVYDNDFKVVYSKEIPDLEKLAPKKSNVLSNKEFVDDDGNFYMIGMLEEKEKKHQHIYVVKYDRASDKVVQQVVDLGGDIVETENKAKYVMVKPPTRVSGQGFLMGRNRGLHIQFNKGKGKIYMGSAYANETGGGLFVLNFDMKTNQLSPINKKPFPKELIDKVSKESFDGKEVKGLVSFQDLVVKQNEEIMCLLEIDKSEVPIAYGNQQPKAISGDVRDILYINFSTDGSISFYGNISKLQEKVTPSFAAACVGNDVHVTYMEGKKNSKQLWGCTIDANGKLSKRELVSFGDDTEINPNKLETSATGGWEWITELTIGIQYPIQISPNELLIIGIKDGKNSVLKLTY